MTPAYQSPLTKLREHWDALASEAPLRHAHPASAGDEASFLASGERLVADHVAPVLAAVDGGEDRPRVLDLGCGPGRLLAPLARHGVVHGVDISPEMLQLARHRVADVSDVRLHLGDGMTLQPVRRHRFDLVVAVDLFAHLPDGRIRPYLLRQIGARLTGAGVLLLTMPTDAATGIDPCFAHSGLAVQEHTPDASDPATTWVRASRQTAGPEGGTS